MNTRPFLLSAAFSLLPALAPPSAHAAPEKIISSISRNNEDIELSWLSEHGWYYYAELSASLRNDSWSPQAVLGKTEFIYSFTTEKETLVFPLADNPLRLFFRVLRIHGEGDDDGDGMNNAWEIDHGLDPLDSSGDNGANGDPDADGLTNASEFAFGSDPNLSDTDSDGLDDGTEAATGRNPALAEAPGQEIEIFHRADGSIHPRTEIQTAFRDTGHYIFIPLDGPSAWNEEFDRMRALIHQRFIVVSGTEQPGSPGSIRWAGGFEELPGPVDASRDSATVLVGQDADGTPGMKFFVIPEPSPSNPLSDEELWQEAKNSSAFVGHVAGAAAIAQADFQERISSGELDPDSQFLGLLPEERQRFAAEFLSASGVGYGNAEVFYLCKEPWRNASGEITGWNEKETSVSIPVKATPADTEAHRISDAEMDAARSARAIRAQPCLPDETLHFALLKAARDAFDSGTTFFTTVHCWNAGGQNAPVEWHFRDKGAFLKDLASLAGKAFAALAQFQPEGTDEAGAPLEPYTVPVLALPVFILDKETETGVDTWERLFKCDRLKRPSFMVPASTPGGNTHTLDFTPDDPGGSYALSVQYPPGKSGTVQPAAVWNPPAQVTHASPGPFGENEKGFAALQKIQNAPAVNLAVYPRRDDKKIAVHAITLPNDDVLILYPENPDDPDSPMTPIKPGCGKPGTICIEKTPGDPGGLYTNQEDRRGDDVLVRDVYGNIDHVTTGPDGICQTKANPHDIQKIKVGQGAPNIPWLDGGANGAINTPGAKLSEDGSKLTTGPFGRRDHFSTVPARIEPQNIPTAAEIKEFLDNVFGKQANIWFQVTLDHHDVAYDVGDPSGNNAQYYPGFAEHGNGEYDFWLPKDIDTDEEALVYGAANDESAFMNFYLMPSRLRYHQLVLDKHYTSDAFDGHGVTNKKKPVMEATGVSKQALLWAMAHEIGHNALYGSKGLVHPRDPKTDLPDTSNITSGQRGFPLATLRDDQKRLMWGTIYCWGTSAERQRQFAQYKGNAPPMRINPKTNRQWAVLIKQEWDVLQGVSDANISPLNAQGNN